MKQPKLYLKYMRYGIHDDFMSTLTADNADDTFSNFSTYSPFFILSFILLHPFYYLPPPYSLHPNFQNLFLTSYFPTSDDLSPTSPLLLFNSSLQLHSPNNPFQPFPSYFLSLPAFYLSNKGMNLF